MWRQTRRASPNPATAREDMFRTVLFAGIIGALIDGLFSFYLHVPSDALMLVLMLSAAVGLSRPLALRTIPVSGFAKRPRAARALVGALALAAVGVSVFGPSVLAPLVPFDTFIERARGPVAHALGDAVFTPTERSLGRVFGRVGALQMLAARPNPGPEIASEYAQAVQEVRETGDRFVRSREIAPYRGQASYYAGQCYARFAEASKELAAFLARSGWRDSAAKAGGLVVPGFETARAQLRAASEEYRFRQIYYELAKVDYYLAVREHIEGTTLKRQGQEEEGQSLLDRARHLMEEAEACFRLAARIYPLSVDYHHDLAKFLLTVKKDKRGSLEAWRQAYRLDPSIVENRLLPEAQAQAAVGDPTSTEIAEGIFSAAFELAKEFRDLEGQLACAQELCEFYSAAGRSEDMQRVAIEMNKLHPDRSEAFWLATYYLGRWGRIEKLRSLVLAPLEERPLDVPLFERCQQVDLVYRYRNDLEGLLGFWHEVASHAVEPEVIPRLEAQIGYRALGIGRNPEKAFESFALAAEAFRSLSPSPPTPFGNEFPDRSFLFLLPMLIQ